MKTKYLIIGQGLAGTALAFQLYERNEDFVMVDDFPTHNSSKVAAGLVNPIAGRRFAKTWLADQILPYSEQFYRDKEELLGTTFYHRKPIYRYFGSIDDQNTWMGRSSDPAISPYTGEMEEKYTQGIRNEYGVVHITQGGYLDTRTYLDYARRFFLEKGHLREGKVTTSSNLEIQLPDGVEAEHILFCEGYKAVDNPLFSWLPFTFAKGELITVSMEGVAEEVIHNRSGFIVPLGQQKYRVGATYRWNEMDTDPTERSLNELKERLGSLTDVPFNIIKQEAAIRPTVKDRRPLIGTHPQVKNAHIFNGFGSKGVTLVPYFAEHFLKALEGKMQLMDEVDILRFYNG